MNPYDIIRRPRISEKTVHLQNKLSSYTFEVHPDANKIQIRDALKKYDELPRQRTPYAHSSSWFDRRMEKSHRSFG
jgi:Ribosomal protein L23